MAILSRPTIKGMFVRSHIKAVERALGKEGVDLLARRYGKTLDFRNNDDIPVAEEVRIIECALDVLQPNIPEKDRPFEAGKLHFRDFNTTPLATIIFSLYRKDFKRMILGASHIAGHVFQGVRFEGKELGPKSLSVTMHNNDYPIDHFRGLFSEWMEFSGEKGDVVAEDIEPGVYRYTMEWQ